MVNCAKMTPFFKSIFKVRLKEIEHHTNYDNLYTISYSADTIHIGLKRLPVCYYTRLSYKVKENVNEK